MAGCIAPAGRGPGGTGAAASRQHQRLWRVRPHVRRRYPPQGAEAGQPPVRAGQAVGGGGGPQQGHGAHGASAALGELPAAVLDALPAPRTPLDVADVQHSVGLPGARMQHALLCMAAAADGGMSMLATVSLQDVQDAMQQQRMHDPQPSEESAKRWLRVESVPSTHTVGVADMGRLVVLEGAEYWACVRVEPEGLEWVVVTACRLRRQQSRGPACYRVFRECLREPGPVRRAHKCTAEDIPPAPAVFVEVTRRPAIQGQDVWRIAPSNMWQAEHAAVMCRALQGHAAALPRAPAAQSSSNRPAASLALLHSVSRAWSFVVAALEPHSSALHLYDRGEGTVLTVRPADLEALHLGALSGDGGEALYLQGTVAGAAATRFRRQSGGDALRLVMAENMGPWLRAFSAPTWKVEGDREKFADAWHRWVEEQFPVGGMLHLPQPPSVPPVRPAAPPATAARQARKAAPKPPLKRGLQPQYGGYTNIRYVLQHFGGDLATEQRGTETINVCPWSRLDGAGHCTWKAGTHCRPTHLHPQNLLDQIQRDHATDWAQRDQARGMPAGVMPGGQAGPFASAQARSRVLMLPTGARPAAERGASPSVARSGAIGSAARRGAVTSTGSTAESTSGGQAEGEPAASAGSQQTTAASGGGPRGQGPPRQPPAPGAGGPPEPAGGPPPSGGQDPAGGPGPHMQP